MTFIENQQVRNDEPFTHKSFCITSGFGSMIGRSIWRIQTTAMALGSADIFRQAGFGISVRLPDETDQRANSSIFARHDQRDPAGAVSRPNGRPMKKLFA